MTRLLPQNWNDSLSFLILLGVPALWVWGGLSETVLGATIMGWTLVLQFYFRRSREEPPPVPHG